MLSREELITRVGSAARRARPVMVAALLGVLAYLWLGGSSPSDAAPPDPTLPLLDGIALLDGPTPSAEREVLLRGTGWPFAELPEVVKFVAAPVPEVGIPLTRSSLYREPVLPVIAASVIPADSLSIAPWLLLPAAAGVLALAERTEEDPEEEEEQPPVPPEPPSPEVVPEPATLLLLGTGLLVLGIGAYRRKA